MKLKMIALCSKRDIYKSGLELYSYPGQKFYVENIW